MITKLTIQNFKIYRDFSLTLNPDLNIVVGDNEAGKSTILEAIQLVLTKRLNGRSLEQELSPFLFNKQCVADYLTALRAGSNPQLPTIIIELYLESDSELAVLSGTNNTDKSDSVGIKIEVIFNDEYRAEYSKMLESREAISGIPVEYYRVNWYSFANNPIFRCPVGVSNIDATTIRLQSGTDYYLQSIIGGSLEPRERVELAIAYRKLKEDFSQEEAIKSINAKLTRKQGAITNKQLAISLDVSHKSSWENSLIPHLDELPFQLIGKGEQSALKIMLALERNASESHVILVEEPENHLSYSAMNTLIQKIRERCSTKQLVIVTHSAFVLNKLGIDNVILLNNQKTTSLKLLPAATYDYFRKLPGYDTLRLILAKRAILVEGPSDELVVQKAYRMRHNKLPIEDGVDVISLRGLSFARFLDIARLLNTKTAVITDNDGDYQNKVVRKYSHYTAQQSSITIHADADNEHPTLEPQLVKVNDLDVLNRIFGTACSDKAQLKAYMENNKTECALKLFDTTQTFVIPTYINDAIA